MTNIVICEVDGCIKPLKHRGWCLSHYKRWYKYGDPTLGAPSHYTNPDDAFAAKTRIDVESGCLLWTGSSDYKGYGSLRIKGKLVKAHRFAWARKNGPIPNGKLVLHRCDNPSCVNADHLFIGTHTDNVRDMDNKGRRVNGQLKGELCHAAKLSEDDIVAIRNDTRRQVDVAKNYGISQTTVSKIQLKQTWRHVA